MVYIEVDNYNKMSEIAGRIIAEQIKTKHNSVIGLATGSTPIGTYENLVDMNRNGEIDFSNVTTINLDEYVGLNASDEQSYRYFMNKNLFDHINIDMNNTFVPNGKAQNLEDECCDYDKIINDKGGIDLLLLGIGNNGHIGFNEPDEKFIKCTHKVDLNDSTITANSRFFNTLEDVPKSAITMGIGAIMNAKKILLIANGANKKDVLNMALKGEITPKIPASILQLHKDVVVIYSNT